MFYLCLTTKPYSQASLGSYIHNDGLCLEHINKLFSQPRQQLPIFVCFVAYSGNITHNHCFIFKKVLQYQ